MLPVVSVRRSWVYGELGCLPSQQLALWTIGMNFLLVVSVGLNLWHLIQLRQTSTLIKLRLDTLDNPEFQGSYEMLIWLPNKLFKEPGHHTLLHDSTPPPLLCL